MSFVTLSSVTEELDLLLDRINDLIKYRIEGVLNEMSKTKLVELPTAQPLSITEFVEKTEVRSQDVVQIKLFRITSPTVSLPHQLPEDVIAIDVSGSLNLKRDLSNDKIHVGALPGWKSEAVQPKRYRRRLLGA